MELFLKFFTPIFSNVSVLGENSEIRRLKAAA
jgi:hypothetical protein